MSQRPLGPHEKQILDQQRQRVQQARETLQEEAENLQHMVMLVAGPGGKVNLDEGVVVLPEEDPEDAETDPEE